MRLIPVTNVVNPIYRGKNGDDDYAVSKLPRGWEVTANGRSVCTQPSLDDGVRVISGITGKEVTVG